MPEPQKHASMAYYVDFGDTSLSLPERKALETELLDALIRLAEAHGAREIEIGDIIRVEDGGGKLVTLTSEGGLDLEALGESLRKAIEAEGDTDPESSA